MKPNALIIYADGTNRESDVAYALELAGAKPEIVHLNQLRAGTKHWQDYQMLVVPGGFSYADTLGAGRLLALDLKVYFADAVHDFVMSGKPVIGICNGFQTLVKTGLLPAIHEGEMDATLTFNTHGEFECRWVTLIPESKKCIWTKNLVEPIYCPVAHGEGNFILRNPDDLTVLQANDQIALRYGNAAGKIIATQHPFNPNGSIAGIAGVCNPQGNVLGLMPHPEDHVLAQQHPRWTRKESGGLGLALFENGVNYAAQC